MAAPAITRGPAPISDTERTAGRRAPYHVHYRDLDAGALRFDPVFQAETPEAAARELGALARELGARIEVLRVHIVIK